MLRNSFILLSIFIIFACKNQPKAPKDRTDHATLNFQEEFAKRFPKVQDVIWDTLDNSFAALFSDNKFEYKVVFDKNGVYQYTVTFIEQTDLPRPIQSIIEKKYKNAAAAVIMHVDNGKTKTYQIELETSTDYINLEFDEFGKLLKEQKHPLTNKEIQLEEEEGVDQNNK